MHGKAMRKGNVLSLLIVAACCGAIAGCGSERSGSGDGPVVKERRFYDEGDQALIDRAMIEARALTGEPNADLSRGWTPVVLRMEKIDCVKFDLDPPGIGRDASICFKKDSGEVFDHSPVDRSSAH
jgi:hypothetical protein